jgi:hypothetical protein
VGRLFAGFYRDFGRLGVRIRPAWINGQVDHQPDKLGHLGYPLSPIARRDS